MTSKTPELDNIIFNDFLKVALAISTPKPSTKSKKKVPSSVRKQQYQASKSMREELEKEILAILQPKSQELLAALSKQLIRVKKYASKCAR